LEYVARAEFKVKILKEGKDLTARQLEKLTRKMLKAFTADKHWLAALSGEGEVFGSEDPEDEQLVRALGRFNKGEIAFLTRDERLLDRQDSDILSPEAYLALNVSSKPIDFIDLKTQQDAIRPQLEQNIHRVLHHGRYIMGPEVGQLEERLAAYTGTKHCITAASGTEALLISLMALGIKAGDEVITTPFTFVATAEVIVLAGAIPVFVDIEPDTCNINVSLIEEKITDKTKAIMPVSLYGQSADMDEINEIASRHNLPVIEDAAQSFGATYKGQKSWNLSTIGCTSFFPSKPLGCYGDGGAIFTNDDTIAQACREIRVHGQSKRYVHTRIGVGGRMDTVQCAVLMAQRDRFEWEVEQRRKIGERYNQLMDEAGIKRVQQRADRTSVFAQYTVFVENRAQVQRVSQDAGIPTAIHYPVALDEQVAYKKYNNQITEVSKRTAVRVLSLPMGPFLTEKEQENIVSTFVSI
jgi:UDP-2-acetamido-2-deoxy-ribo-hexuluronate aminotransferase